MSIGTDTPIDELLADYLPQNQSWIGELLEDETNALLYAILVEVSDTPRDTAEDYEDTYPTYRGLEVTLPAGSGEGEWHSVSWDFDASEVSVYNAESAIQVAFAPENENTERAITLLPKQTPLSVPMDKASKVWVRRMESAEIPQEIRVIPIA